MIEKCEKCETPFDGDKTFPETVSDYDEAELENFLRLRSPPNPSTLCDQCLLEHIKYLMSSGVIAQD